MLYLFVVLQCLLASSVVVRGRDPVSHIVFAPRNSNIDTIVKSERDLRRDIFSDYDKLVRPVKNPSNGVKLTVGLTLVQLQEVDVKNRNIALDSWISMQWNDDYLGWNPSDYNNITALRIPSSELWVPDLSLYTATPDTALFPTSPTRAIIYPSNKVLWVPYFTIRSRCPTLKRQDKNVIDCHISMGSWVYDGTLLDIQLSSPAVEMKYFQDIHPDWKVMNVKASREDRHYDCCSEPYPLLHFNITLQKRHPFENSVKNDVWREY